MGLAGQSAVNGKPSVFKNARVVCAGRGRRGTGVIGVGCPMEGVGNGSLTCRNTVCRHTSHSLEERFILSLIFYDF
jgi:hypothetical protein